MEGKIKLCSNVITKRLGDELVILDMKNGVYFGLDAVGARIWQLLSEGKEISAVQQSMEGEFDVSPAELRRDIQRLISELASRDLIRFWRIP